MTASDLFQAGRLREAIGAQSAAVRDRPADNPGRFFLFQLLLFAGDLDRARKQLDALRYDDPARTAGVEQYRNALAAEATRRAVFAGGAEPKGLAGAPDHVRLRFEALPYAARGEHAEARRRLDAADEAAPSLAATLDGKPVDGLCDADERFGTVLEVFATGGTYSWVPLERVVSVTMKPPGSPRDVVLRPAHVVLADGVEGDVLLPGLYPNTHEHPDEAVRVGRAAEWLGEDGEVVRGAGGRVLSSAGGAVTPFSSVLQIVPAPAAGPAGA